MVVATVMGGRGSGGCGGGGQVRLGQSQLVLAHFG